MASANINPISGVVFGQERTAQHKRDRARWEHDQAAKIREAKRPVGWQHIVEAHENVARAYERAAQESERGEPSSVMTPREINAIVRAADGRNVYLIRHRLGEDTVHRVVRARMKGRVMDVRDLATGRWIPVMPELGDRFEVR
jgi:hypothetical protein